MLITGTMLIAAPATAPFVRPFRLSRLFWSYVLPVVPVVLFVDGILSCLRAYSPAELIELSGQISAPGYTWETGEAPGFFGPVTYLLGYPPPEAGTKIKRRLRPPKIGAVGAQPRLSA